MKSWLRWFTVSLALLACNGSAGRAVAQATPTPAQAAPLARVSLSDAMDAALRYSPELVSLRSEMSAADARALQAGLWPNPEIVGMVEHFGGSGMREDFETSESTVEVMQPLELAGEPSKRRAVAVLGRRSLDHQLAARRLATVAEVRKRFLKTLLAQARRELTVEMEAVSAEALRTVESRVRAGAAPLTERAQVRILLSRARVERRSAEREIIAARRQLAILWGEAEPNFVADGELEVVAQPPPLNELLSRLERNPVLARWDAEVERRAAAVRLERAKAVPDVVLGAGARHYNDNDDFAAVFDVTVPLPVFDRNQGGIAEAEQLLAKAHANRDLARLRARSELLAAYDDLNLQFDRVAVLGVQVLDDAKAASTEALAAYRRGAAQSLDVLAAQRVLFELQGEYFQALADYSAAVVDVERLTGATP